MGPSWIDETYLWYTEVPAVAASNYGTTVSYFDALKTPAITASGNPKDKFHFTYDSTEWYAPSQEGESVGYGIEWKTVSRNASPFHRHDPSHAGVCG